MKTITLKDYYYDDCLILEDEWDKYYDLDGKVKDFGELLDIFNRCNVNKFEITRDNPVFNNLPEHNELDKITQRETRFGIIKKAIIWGWMKKEIISGKLTIDGIDGDMLLDLSVTFNTILNNIHYGRIKEACIAKNYIYEDRKDVYYLYPVPQILIDELKNHKKAK